MSKQELAKLSYEEQEFIHYNKLENYSLETIKSILKNYNYLVYKGWL